MRRTGFTRLAVVLALLGPLVGFATYRLVEMNERERALESLSKTVNERAFALEHEVAVAQGGVATLAAVLGSFSSPSLSEFHLLALNLTSRYPGIKSLQWAPQVSLRDREHWKEKAQREGLSNFTMTELKASGELGEVTQKESYFPVFYVEPLAGNEQCIGFDLGSESRRLATLVAAAQSGEPRLSDPIRLVQEKGVTLGFLVVVPILRDRSTPKGEGLNAVKGFAVGVLSAENLVEHTFPRGVLETLAEMEIQLVDENPDGSRTVFYSKHASHSTGNSDIWTWKRDIILPGQRWSLLCRPNNAYLKRESNKQSLVSGIMAFLGFELLIGLAISLQKRWREREQHREILFIRSVMRSIPDGVLVAGGNDAILVANAKAREILGGGPKNIPRKDWSKAYGLFLPGTTTHFPEDQLPLARAMRGETVTDVEVFVRNQRVPDGIWVSVSAAPLLDARNEVSGGVTVFRDITAKKMTDDLARRLFSAVEQTTDSVFITDDDGVISYVNPAFEQTIGYTREEALGQTPRLFKSGKQGSDYYDQLWSTLKRGECFKATVVNRRKNGEHFFAEQAITPIRDDDTGQVSHYVSLLRDMTDQIKLREQDVEMRVGASVQKKLFPQRSPALDGYDIAGIVAPALLTSGDYYDFIALPDGRLLLVVADVCGHGLGAAMIMAVTRAYLHSFAQRHVSLCEIVPMLNKLLLNDLEDRLFVTMFLGLLDPGSGKIEWANMGHPSGLVLAADGTLKAVLSSTCKPLGLFPEIDCSNRPPTKPGGTGSGRMPGRLDASFDLEPGETLVLVTDGVIETTSPDDLEFGIQTLIDTVQACREYPADEIAARVVAAVREFAHHQPQEDDITVVVSKRALD